MKRTLLCVLMIFVLGSMTVFGTTNKNVIWGAYTKYKSSTEIYITAGSGRCNDSQWENATETTLNLYGITPAGEDFIYIYIDDSASSYPTPTFIGSLTEPAWSNTLIGWYNGDDRCIGVVWRDSSDNILQFQNNDQLEYAVYYGGGIKQVVTNGNPSSSWQTAECTAYIPINANSVYAYASNIDTGSSARVILAPYENSVVRLGDTSSSGTHIYIRGWLPLERNASRDLQWYGYNDDDNTFQVYILGFRIER